MATNSETNGDCLSDQKGGRLSEQSINYFKRVEQVLKENTFEDDEHKETFLKNVFEQVKKEEAQLTRHTLTSRVLEMIIPLLSSDQIESLLQLYYKDLNALCGDRFGSHVIQCLIDHIHQHTEHETVVKIFCKWCKALRSELSNHIRDIYGHHIVGSILQTLSGVKIPGTANKNHKESSNKKKKHFNPTARKEINFKDLTATAVPADFSKQFRKMGKAFQEDDNFGELLCHRSGCSVLQTLLLVLKCADEDSYSKLASFICQKANIFSSENTEYTEEEQLDLQLPVVLTDQMGSHLLETIICAANETLLDDIYSKCIKKYLLPLSLHDIGNYVIQTYMRATKVKEQAIDICEKLLKYVEDILAAGCMGVAIQVAETIARLKLSDLEGTFITTISESLHIPTETKPKAHLVRLLLCLLTYDMLYTSKKEVEVKEEGIEKAESKKVDTSGTLTKDLINIHGVNLTKALFTFKNNNDVVKSFLKLTKDELLLLCYHCSGSFSVEAFFQSAEVSVEDKNKCFCVLEDNTLKLATDKFGSRVLDKVWLHVDKPTQKRLSKELNDSKHVLERSMYGRIILRNCSFTASQLEPLIEKLAPKRKKRPLKEENQTAEQRPTKTDKRKCQNKEAVPVKHVKREEVVPVKKVKKDRAERYREELAKMGISLQTDDKTQSDIVADKVSIKVEPNVISDDLSVILAAVDSSAKTQKAKKKKQT